MEMHTLFSHPRPAHCGLCPWLLVVLCLPFVSCDKEESPFTYTRPGGEKGVIRLEGIHDSLFVLHHLIDGVEQSAWQLPYPVFRFTCGDLNGDSLPEIAVGVVKATRYSPTREKRLFLFKLYQGRLIRPLWLGSRMPLPLVDFHLVRDTFPHRLCTTEQRPDGTRLQALYRLGSFGPVFERYLQE